MTPVAGIEAASFLPRPQNLDFWTNLKTGGTVDTWFGRIAQSVEQLTLNQRVVGSNPTAPTNIVGENEDRYLRSSVGVSSDEMREDLA